MRPRSALVVVVTIVCSLALMPAVSAVPVNDSTTSNACVGTMTDPADGPTVMTVQGVRFADSGVEKTPALLLSVGPRGEIQWIHNSSAQGRWWTYDVDPLSNGNLLVTGTEPGITVVEEFDPRAGRDVWVKRFEGVGDAHDVDLINGDELLIADKGQGHHRVLVYDRTSQTVVWEWRFADHYPESVGGPQHDWTHVNDVDKIREGEYLVSVRNFDQIIVINRSTEAIDLQLGADNDYEIMNEQHNPQYLVSDRGVPTILIADSENDRVVEYALENGSWTRTWMLSGGGLNEPRDADRLPNGNTLIVDRHGHRTVEVTPNGTVVWEFYVPWQPYDAERTAIGDEPGGPTTRDLNASGSYELTGSAGFDTEAIERCAATLNSRAQVTIDVDATGDATTRSNDGVSDAPVVDDPMADDPTRSIASDHLAVGGIAVTVVVLVLVGIGIVYRRRRRFGG